VQDKQPIKIEAEKLIFADGNGI